MFKHVNEYVCFSDEINNYLSAIMIDNKISHEEYHYFYIWELVKSQGVSIRGFDFKETTSECIFGMLVEDQLEPTIVFNQQLDVNTKNFVISHEIIHYLFHKNEKNVVFIDTKESLKNHGRKTLQEFQANIGASAILMPDEVLIYFLKKGWSLVQLSNSFALSEEDIAIRLIQIMQANFELSFRTAKNHADDIRYHFNEKGKTTAILLATELEYQLKKKQTKIDFIKY